MTCVTGIDQTSSSPSTLCRLEGSNRCTDAEEGMILGDQLAKRCREPPATGEEELGAA